MLDLYFHATPNSMKVAVLLYELGLDFNVKPIDIFKGEQHAATFKMVNPNSKVPAIVDGDVTVFDSHAILLYLAEKYSALIPGTPAEKASMLSWLQLVATGLSPFSGQAIHFLKYAPDIPYAKERYVGELARHYRILDDRLAQSEWLSGSTYSIADIALWGWLASADFIFGKGALAGYPALQRFMQIMAERSAVQRAVELKGSFQFKHEMDQQSRTALFTHR